MKNKKILIIGKHGQLAQALISEAGDFGVNQIVAFDRHELDVTKSAKLIENIREINPDLILNTSVFHVMSQCEADPYKAFRVNFLAVRNIARLSKEIHAIFVTFSSDYVFSGCQGRPNTESDLSDPLQIYGLSKLAGEDAALSIYPEGSYVIRTSGLYGGFKGSPDKGNFVLNMLKEATEDKSIIEVSSEQVVSPTYVIDLAKAVWQLLSLNPSPGIYHLVNEGYASWYNFTKEIFYLASIKKKLKGVNRGGYSGNSNRPTFSALANIKAKDMGVVLPKWQDGLRNYLEFLKNIDK